MKKTYISPTILVRNLFGDSVMESNVIEASEGEGSYHEDVDPEKDPETGEPVRAKSSIWDIE